MKKKLINGHNFRRRQKMRHLECTLIYAYQKV
jgi:hypothetical protein